jgi:glycosyltransferase involved in cell wall biosynthesis
MMMKTRHAIAGMLISAVVAFHLGSFLNSGISSRLIERRTNFDLETVPVESQSGVASAQAVQTIPNDPVYWIADEQDDFFERTYFDTTLLKNYRPNKNIRHYFQPVCALYRFDESRLPTVSVIMTLRNEQPGMVSLTVHAILARTPTSLLAEVIIVDDSNEKNDTELQELQAVSDKVVVLPTSQREGCARSRLIGARKASGTVLMFVDSHVEMLSSTWYQHLVLPIVDNPHTIASQQLQYMDDVDGHAYRDKKARGSHYGTTNEKFNFGYQSIRFPGYSYEQKPSATEPYEMPFAPGALFAIRADEFWRLGGYDEGLYVWGGENMELSLKIWLCGGRLVQVPCSNTGHMYRVHDAHKWTKDNFDEELLAKLRVSEPGEYRAHGSKKKTEIMARIWLRNNIRVAKVWLGEARLFYYKKVFGSKRLPPEWEKFEKEDDHMLEQILLKEKNKCHDFEWFDQHVFMRLLGVHHPWYKAMTTDQKPKSSTNETLSRAY